MLEIEDESHWIPVQDLAGICFTKHLTVNASAKPEEIKNYLRSRPDYPGSPKITLNSAGMFLREDTEVPFFVYSVYAHP